MNGKSHWTRAEAERRIGDVLDSARAGVSQTIAENDGEFVVRFVPKKADVESAARVLARGGPDTD